MIQGPVAYKLQLTVILPSLLTTMQHHSNKIAVSMEVTINVMFYVTGPRYYIEDPTLDSGR